MHQHDQSSCPDVVDQPGETDEGSGGHMVNDLLFKILQDKSEKITVLVTHWLSRKDVSLINCVLSLADAGFNDD